MNGCIGRSGVRIDIHKIADALKAGNILATGSSCCMPNEAWEIATNMVDGAVCGTKTEDWCEDCPKFEDESSARMALVDDVQDAVHSLELAMKSQSWAMVGSALRNLKDVVE